MVQGPQAGPESAAGARAWWALVAACSGLFLLMLDSTVVTLALPSLQEELTISGATLQWVMNAYLLVLAAFVVTAGRLGDILGRRAVFAAGLLIFVAGSVLAALADSGAVIVAARVIQGLGAAALLALSLAITSHAFPESQQPRALGIWAAVSAIALAIGPLVGGALATADWRLIFWINVPIGLAGLAMLVVAVEESRDETASRRIDYRGLVALGAGLTAIVLALVESDRWGFDSPATLGLLAAGVVSLLAFWALERRVAEPIVEFSLFRNRPYFGASAAAFCLVGAYWALMFFQPQYLQNVLGYSAIASGVLILPITAPMALISPLAGRLIARFGTRAPMTLGMACSAVGLLILTTLDQHSSYAHVFAGYLLFGIAIGLVYAPMSTAAMGAMPREKAGIASGVLAMNRVLAGALGLAITGAIVNALQPADPFGTALAEASWVLVALTVLGTALTWWFLEPAERERPRAVAAEGAELRHHMHHRRFHL